MRLKDVDRTKLGLSGIGLAVVCFLAVNLFSSLTLGSYRLDLTEKELYTLSEGTKKTLVEIQEPITLRLYVSRQLTDAEPRLKTYAARVREFLGTYVRLAHDRVRLKVVNPEPFSREEDLATAFGLQGIQAGESTGYFGLVGTNSTDDVDTIPFLSPQREVFLEYDLTRLIYNLAHPKKPVVALVDGIGLQGGPQNGFQSWQVLDLIRQFFEVRSLAKTADEIDDDVDILMLVHPHGLSDRMLYAIDQFVLRGGQAVVFLDPNAESAPPDPRRGMRPLAPSSNLERLMKAWGVEMVEGKEVGDRRNAVRVRLSASGRVTVTDYLPWLAVSDDELNGQDVITGQLDTVSLRSAGVLGAAEGASTTLTPLIRSSPDSMLIDVDNTLSVPEPDKLLQNFKPSDTRYTLAARIHGRVKTAFPDGPPKADRARGDESASASKESTPGGSADTGLKESVKPVNLVVVADVDMLADDSWLQAQSVFGSRVEVPVANNADFVVNALENLAGGDALIGLRGRGVSQRPFTTVQRIRAEADAKYRATERELQKKLEETQKKLSSLQSSGKGAGETLLTPEQQETIEKFRSQMLTIREQLRDVQYALRKDIDLLETRLKLVNIVTMPALVALFAIGLAVWRSRRARRYRNAQTISTLR